MALVYANNSGTLQCMGGSVNLGSIIQSYVSGAGVNTLNGLNGNIDLISADGTIGVDASGSEISLIVNQTALPGRVASLNTLTDTVNIVSGDGSITVDTSGNNLNIVVANPALASMVWNIENPLLGASTVSNIAPTNAWTNVYQLIRTLTLTIPIDWSPRNSTLPTLFIWTTFTTTGPTNQQYFSQQYFTYQVNAGAVQPLAGTSSTRPYANQGQNQFTPITGVMTGVPLAMGDTLTICIWGRMIQLASIVMTNPAEQVFGVLTTGF
jgi:hypothetical protein